MVRQFISKCVEIRGLVYLFSKQSSAHRTSGFLGNGFIYKCIETESGGNRAYTRGPVREMGCDRGTNFTGAEAELKKAIEEIDDQKKKEEPLKESIDWIKNPALASNFGGV